MGAQAHYVTANDVRNGLRDLSLIMGRRGQVKFNPYKKAGGGGVEKVSAMLKRGQKKF